MGNYKILNIKGVLLDKYQLETYLAKLASDNILKNASDKNTYPIPRLKDNFEYITNVYNTLTEHIKLGIPIHPAGEWILDNYYIIEKVVKTIIKNMPLKKYISFVGLDNGNYKGFARIYVLASEIIAFTDAQIDRNNLSIYLQAYQSKKNLSMNEIWNIGTFLQIALIENIRGLCEKIYSSQIQKYKVENIIERLVENKDKLKFKTIYINKNAGTAEMKYPFIEYMSYRLKQHGKQAYSYLQILEEQVEKMGLNISEVVQKEHFDIAVKKVSMGNSIVSINMLIRVNFLEIFEQINGVEEILKQDPVNVYSKMDYKTKAYYRNEIEKIAKKTKISEMYIAKKCLELAEKSFEKVNLNELRKESKKEFQNEYQEKSKKESKNKSQNKSLNEYITENASQMQYKKAHIGYYLISKGRSELLSELLNKKIKPFNNKTKMKIYVYGIFILSFLISLLCGTYMYNKCTNLVFSILIFVIALVPSQTFVVQILQYVLGKLIKPKMIPKLDCKAGVPNESTTMVIIPTIVKNREKVNELFSKLEVYYIANKSENLYFTLLGDCSSGENEKESFDEEIVEEGIKQINRLNKKYHQENFNKFNFIYRKRIWNEKEECYLGWERKRGLINQFNEYVLGKIKNPFLFNSFEQDNKSKQSIPAIKFIITLDSDTDLVLNSGLELIGAMSHILNVPVIDENKNVIIDGHALMQPRVGVGLLEVRRSLFTKIFSGLGGTDSYVNAIFDVYQDNFDEGIFTGKGIYNLQVFSNILRNEIPENTVLSHDLLEGSYLRCGMISDVMLMDGYPTSYVAFKTRLHRWIRGDYQILGWIKNKKLNILSKYKIIDNILRSELETSVLCGLIVLIIIKNVYEISIFPIILFLLTSLLISNIIEIINKIIFKKDGEKKQKTFIKNQTTVQNSLLKAFFAIATLPDKAYMSCDAAFTSLYRMLKSKKHLLEWVTAEEAEKNTKNTVGYYYKKMIANVVIGIPGILSPLFLKSEITALIIFIISVIWLITPIVMFFISKPIKEINKINLLNNKDKDYIREIANKTWSFFKENINEKTNFLPPDNYQEDRNETVVERTSSTNIGLAMLSCISSYDMKFENLENTISLLEKMINAVICLPKWNGHLYNWYNTSTLEPLLPRFVSSVDSGNLVGYFYVVEQFLEEVINAEKNNTIIQECELMRTQIDNLIKNTDFSKLFDYKSNLFSVGFNIEENKLADSYYDLLASESRQASLVAIAKKDIDGKNWYNLSRSLTVLNKYKGLISWSGTAFEYLMPNINIPKYPGSLLDESCKFLIMSQIEYAKKIGIPWGISESAFNLKDLNNHYQYKAFGIPWLGLKRGLADEMVISPYASILAITEQPQEVLENLRRLEKMEMVNKYGFYEAIDFTPGRVNKNKKYELVRTYMAHHQGLILLSINNLFNDNILQKRFMKNPEMQAINILLEERMPENVIITKEKKEKIEKIKYNNYSYYFEKTISKVNSNFTRYNLIANKNYTLIIDDKGNGYSKFNNILVNKYKPTSDINEGIYFYLKNIRNKKIWSNGYNQTAEKPDKYSVTFAQDKASFTRLDGNIETNTKITVSSNDSVEIRRIELKNLGNIDETLEITSFIEPVLSVMNQEYAHPAFNNLFLIYEYIEETNSILVKRKNRANSEKEIYMVVNLYSEEKSMGETEFEINKEKFWGRNNFGIPKLVENSTPFSKKIELTTNSVIALRKTITIKARENVKLDLIICVSDNKEYVLNTVKKYMNIENNNRIFELSRARVEAENRYLEVDGKNIELYQKILPYIIGYNIQQNKLDISSKFYPVTELWKFGISGDVPIIFAKIKNINDIDVISELIKLYEYFRTKKIEIDLVILNEEKENYNSYVKDAIYDEILNKNIEYVLNQKGGIFVLNNIKQEDENLISFYSKLTIDAQSGNLNLQLKELEDEMLPVIINENQEITEKNENDKNEDILLEDNLKYFNEYGGFSEDGKEYIFKINKENNVPAPWSHIMANKNIGTVVTECMGGYTWHKNSRLNRISAWANNAITDIPSETIFMRDDESKKIWSLGYNPMPDNNDYIVCYGFGYARFMHNSNGIKQEVEVFIPKEDSVKVQLIKLKNETPRKRKIKLVYYWKPVLGEDELKTCEYMSFEFNKNNNIIYAKNLTNEHFRNFYFVSSSEQIKSYTGSKKEFMGNGNISKPQGLNLNNFSNKFVNKVSNIVAIEFEVELESLENKEISIMLGTGENMLECKDLAYKYRNINNCNDENEKNKKYWQELLNNIQVKTPVESMNILLNGWAMYQTIVSRLIGRTGFYQSGGAYGFRDQLQDVIAAKYVDADITRNQIIQHSQHQFIEGDVEHWWHEETKMGIRTRFSDDLLWLPFVTADYIEYTGDYSILSEVTPYLEGALLEDGIDEKYDLYLPGKNVGTIYEHCIKAIEKSLDFGEHGLPKIGSGDWNDGFSTVGNKGKGESVWLAFFLCTVLNKFVKICEHVENGTTTYNRFENKYENEHEKIYDDASKNELEKKSIKYKKIIEQLRKSVNNNAWDGRWFKRAFMDDGRALGSIENDECKIDGISQSWCVISNIGDNDKKYISMESLENHLIDKENGIIKLLDPPFEKGSFEPGYIKSYIPGTRENGGQYTHAAVWVIIAEAMLGFGDKAVDLFRMINPIEHSKTKDGVIKYKVEPYCISADIYGQGNLAGRGGWTWYTGSSSWMYVAGIKYILGITVEDGYLSINPIISSTWKEYSVRLKFGNSIYNVKVNNISGKSYGVEEIIVNSEEIVDKRIKIRTDGGLYEIEVKM